MKKKDKIVVTSLITILLIVILVMYFVYHNPKEKRQINKVTKASKDYFEKYMRINDSTSIYVITLDMLENANKQGENYNLSGLEKCKKQSTFSKITYTRKKEIKIKVELNC